MELKLKQLKSTNKLDYNGYKKLAKATWETLLAGEEPTGYALVAGQYLFWKNSKPEALSKQPLLYVGPTTKWKMELNGHSEMTLQDYSYGTCKVTKKGAHIHVALLPIKGKLTQEKLLKPIQKELKKIKPKVLLEVVSAFEEEPREERTLNKEGTGTIEQVLEVLQPLLELDKLIITEYGGYKAWRDSFDAIKKSAHYILQVKAFLAPIIQTNVSEFSILYNALSKPERRAYKEEAQVIKGYKKLKTYAQEWLENVALFKELMVERQLLSKAYDALELNNNEDNIIVVEQAKVVPMKALLSEMKAFHTKLKDLPKSLKPFRDIVTNKFLFPYMRLLQLGLERTAEKLENPMIQPAAHPDHGNYSLRRIKGDLFKGSTKDVQEPLIADNDVMQGSLGDCYLMASLIGLAKKCPEVIRQAIEEKRNGNQVTYEVTLYFLDTKDNTKLVPQKVHVDNQFVVDTTGNTAYAKQGDQGELWPLVIEKAMAKALAGYKELAGGNTEWALRMLTGEFPKNKEIQNVDETEQKATTEAEIIQLLKDNRGKLITVSVGKPKAIANLFTVESSTSTSTESHRIKFDKETIYCNHAYVIEAVDYDQLESAGRTGKPITLYNPHSTTEKTRKFPQVNALLLKHIAAKITLL